MTQAWSPPSGDDGGLTSAAYRKGRSCSSVRKKGIREGVKRKLRVPIATAELEGRWRLSCTVRLLGPSEVLA
jgi:hypothetical protein